MEFSSFLHYLSLGVKHKTFDKQKLTEIRRREYEEAALRPKKTKYGFSLFLDPADRGGSVYIYRHGTYNEPDTTELFLRLLSKPVSLFVDVGANIGWYSLLAAQAGAKRIVSYEPDSRTSKYFGQSIRLNHFEDTIELKHACLMDYTGKTQFIETSEPNKGKSSAVRANIQGNKVERDCFTLEESFPNEQISILKLDAEGAESKVLMGGKKLLSERRIDHIIMEWNEDSWVDQDSFLRDYLMLNYEKAGQLKDTSVPNVHFRRRAY